MIRFPRRPCSRPHGRSILAVLLLGWLVAMVTSASAQMSLTADQRARAGATRDACGADYARFCRGVHPGGGRVLQCLQAHAADLAPACRAALPAASELRKSVGDGPAK